MCLMRQMVQLGRDDIEVEREGDPDGEKVLFTHGLPGTALEIAIASALARRGGYEVLGISRRGYGHSRYRPTSLVETARETPKILEKIGVKDPVHAIGVSAGGVYTAALAHECPDALRSVTLVSALAPPDQPGVMDRMNWSHYAILGLARKLPACFLSPILYFMRHRALKNPDALLHQVRDEAPPGDQEVLRVPANHEVLRQSLIHALRCGYKGLMQDILNLAGPWGFDPKDIKPHVEVWHGTDDLIVPKESGVYYGSSLNSKNLHMLDGRGHFIGADEAVLEQILTTARDRCAVGTTAI